MQYVLLGDSVEGDLACLSFGVDMAYARKAHAAARYYKGGGVANQGAGGPGDPGGLGGPGSPNHLPRI